VSTSAQDHPTDAPREAAASAVPTRIALSLVSHTNTGKTTLARTLLGRDVGEVRDAAHVTQEAASFVMIETPQGDRLELWDTPGFGDSARLARRLRQQGNPIGWFLSQVWDRFRDRPFWLAQQAVRNVRDHADIVLYLVNAAEDPHDAGWLAPELEVLAWIGKPVLMLLNQTGVPRPRADEVRDVERWRAALPKQTPVQAGLPLDAFARCWVQESMLLDAVAGVLDGNARTAMQRLAAQWRTRRMEQFDAAVDALVRPIADAARDRGAIGNAEAGGSRWRELGRFIGLSKPGDGREERVLQELAQRVEQGMTASTDALIAIYGLEGRASSEIRARVASSVTTEAPADEKKAAMLGGIVSGALSGLIADLAAGGLTLGAGMLAGGVLGALGGAGLARGFNIARGRTETVARWSDEFLDGLVQEALLRYLAVAHYGRGRGEWREAEYPPFWRSLVESHVGARRDALREAWTRLRSDGDASAQSALVTQVRGLALELLDELYPGGVPVRPGDDADERDY
jgi:hypothetical protein